MVEGSTSTNRSGKRPTFGKSTSNPELRQQRRTDRKAKGRNPEERWPFLDGLTVDELGRYRRRRIQSRPKDTLPQEDTCKWPWPGRSKHQEDYVAYSEMEFSNRIRKGPSCTFELVGGANDANSGVAMQTETESSRFIAHANPIGRPPLVRRGTSLKREGQFYTDTEHICAYVPYEGKHKAELARRPTSLRLEGELDTMTEKREKFIKWLNVSRAELVRFPMNLKLEGDFEISTENHDNYVPFVGVRRPELMRRNTSLKLEGVSPFLAEYDDSFNRVEQGDIPVEQFSEPTTDDPEEEKKKKKKQEEEMKWLLTKLEDLKGPAMEIPEYRDAYKNFPRERPKLSRPEDEIGRADGSVIRSPTHSVFSTKIDQDPEYRSKYLDYPCERASFCASATPTAPRLNENYWSSKKSGENAVQEQDAFQVVAGRVQTNVLPRAITQSSRNRSSSPTTYRLHVYNVDDKPQGFGVGRPLQSSALIEHQDRPYSPSFGKLEQQPTNQRSSFLILSESNDYPRAKTIKRQSHHRRILSDNNSNFYDLSISPAANSKSQQTNWMPPWYDATGTI
ncbi:uncharacterized protein [Prorops nasuta]|uniref:uncharacterized protein isoform X2 n=1 Tax=Prorops nasuta TaxID=863751 RepID=UPI0034CD5A7A